MGRLSGRVSVAVAEPLALRATSGRFVLDLGKGLDAKPQFWGVATLETNFKALEQYGIFLFAKGTLQINTTQFTKTETLMLQGLGPNGSDLTRTFVMRPLSSSRRWRA